SCGNITAGCTQYYGVVSGDGFARPSSTCCVASSTSTLTGPPSNVAPGTITQGCTNYNTVVSGDRCASVETKFTLTTLAQFIGMNPETN
ncbi:hypothetical protein B0H14DRAFT_2415023, partial [Mycena olivaceomarginata]